MSKSAKWITSEPAAELLGVSRPTVAKLIAVGKLQPLGWVNGKIAVFDEDYILRVRPHINLPRTGKRKPRQAVA